MVSELFKEMPWLRKLIAKVEIGRSKDLKFVQRWFAGEVDIDGNSVPRNPEAIAAVKTRIAATRQTALLAQTTESVTISRLGGLPNLPMDVDWPSCHGRPLALLAQIDLSELPTCEDLAYLPRKGILFFFAGYGLHGDEWSDEATRVLYAPVASSDERAAPHGIPWMRDVQHIVFQTIDTYASLGPDDDVRQWQDNQELSMWRNELTSAHRHPPLWQIGGWPCSLQELETEWRCERRYYDLWPEVTQKSNYSICENRGKNWQLLGQFDVERLARNSNGYSRGFFWIKESEAQTGFFERVIFLAQAD